MRDQFLQDWNETINNMPKLELYKKFKTVIEYEQYLDVVHIDSLRKQISRIRLSSHSLEIEAGRFNSTDRSQRIC